MPDDIQIGGKWYHPRKRFTTKAGAEKYAASLRKKGYSLMGEHYPPGKGSVRVLQKADIAIMRPPFTKKKFWHVYTEE
jgi:hypothetical protein